MIPIKTAKELEVMQEGGAKLAEIKNELKKQILPGISFEEIEKFAQERIKKGGAKPSFLLVPGYSWATCLNLNQGVVHGIPKRRSLGQGDIVSVDLGIFYRGFHTDTSFSMGVGKVDKKKKGFLQTGKKALEKAIGQAKPKKRVGDISLAMQQVLRQKNLSPVRSLTGHGIGRQLHEEPQIPCFLSGSRLDTPELLPGMVLAIEVIYTMGEPELVLEEDGWTVSTKDGKIAGLFEETVAVTENGPRVLTR